MKTVGNLGKDINTYIDSWLKSIKCFSLVKQLKKNMLLEWLIGQILCVGVDILITYQSLVIDFWHLKEFIIKYSKSPDHRTLNYYKQLQIADTFGRYFYLA